MRYDKLAAITLPSPSSHQYGCGGALMSPRPSSKAPSKSLKLIRAALVHSPHCESKPLNPQALEMLKFSLLLHLY